MEISNDVLVSGNNTNESPHVDADNANHCAAATSSSQDDDIEIIEADINDQDNINKDDDEDNNGNNQLAANTEMDTDDSEVLSIGDTTGSAINDIIDDSGDEEEVSYKNKSVTERSINNVTTTTSNTTMNNRQQQQSSNMHQKFPQKQQQHQQQQQHPNRRIPVHERLGKPPINNIVSNNYFNMNHHPLSNDPQLQLMSPLQLFAPMQPMQPMGMRPQPSQLAVNMQDMRNKLNGVQSTINKMTRKQKKKMKIQAAVHNSNNAQQLSDLTVIGTNNKFNNNQPNIQVTVPNNNVQPSFINPQQPFLPQQPFINPHAPFLPQQPFMNPQQPFMKNFNKNPYYAQCQSFSNGGQPNKPGPPSAVAAAAAPVKNIVKPPTPVAAPPTKPTLPNSTSKEELLQVSADSFTTEERTNPLLCIIIEEGYPDIRPLSNGHLHVVRKLVNSEIDKIPEENEDEIPRFVESYIKNGVILVTAADKQSNEWLQKTIPTLSPNDDVKLKVISINELDRLYKMELFVPHEDNTVEILNRIQKQNPDINMASWHLYEEKYCEGEKPGVLVLLGIPEASLKILKTKEFKLFHGLGQVTGSMKETSFQ